jgi:lactate dehydrogenase-like 2-hydroxyacid dehydrogenase
MREDQVKSVGIIGAGRIGQTMAQIALRAGRRVEPPCLTPPDSSA